MFYFYSPLQTVFSSPTVSDTTLARSSSSTRVTVKSYSLTVPQGANTIRVIVVGNVTRDSGTVWVNINGVDVVSRTVTETTPTRLIDYIGNISPGSLTVMIDASYSGTGEIQIANVFITTGVGVTSTTLSDLITFSVTYQLLRSGDIRYSPGVRLFIYGNRKTTAPTTLQVGSSPLVGRNQLGAGNDNTVPEVFLAIVTGSVTLQEGGEFTVSATLRGGVGATGDIVIITRIQARAQLRREGGTAGEVRVYERGVVEYFARALAVSVPGGSPGTYQYISQRDIQDTHLVYLNISSGGADVYLYNFKLAIVTPIHFNTFNNEDYYGEAFIAWVSLVVWG
jgi:hypothetical protein